MPGRTDIGCFDIAVVDAEIEHEAYFGDEQETEEEGEAAQRFLAAFFERDVIDLVDAGAEHKKCGRHDNGGQDRIEAEADIDDIGDVGTEDDEGGVGDIDDVENAER